MERLHKYKSFNIQSFLISWGLLSTSIDSKDDMKTKFVSKLNNVRQKFNLMFLWFMTLKLFITCFIPIESKIRMYLGDAAGFMGGSRMELGISFVLWTLHGSLLSMAFYINRNNKTMNCWIKIYQICQNSTPFTEHNFDEEMAIKFRKRVNHTILIFKIIMCGSVTACLPAFGWTFVYRWPQSYRNSFLAYFWTLMTTLWVYYNQ